MSKQETKIVCRQKIGTKTKKLKAWLLDTAHSRENALHKSVLEALDNYFDCLDGEVATDIYPMVMKRVEFALLSSVMKYADGNQTKAANYLGMSRGTLLKKLIYHKLYSEKIREND